MMASLGGTNHARRFILTVIGIEDNPENCLYHLQNRASTFTRQASEVHSPFNRTRNSNQSSKRFHVVEVKDQALSKATLTFSVEYACSSCIILRIPRRAFCSRGSSKYSPHVEIPISASIKAGGEVRLHIAIPQSRRTISLNRLPSSRWLAMDPGPNRGRVGSKTARRSRASSRCAVPVRWYVLRCHTSGNTSPRLGSAGRE